MASLIETPPCGELLPVIVTGAQLVELRPGPVLSVAPFQGQAAAVGAILAEAGLDWPAPGTSGIGGSLACFWAGRGTAFVVGPLPEPLAARLAAHAALTDQSDAWAAMQLRGPAAEAVLARLVPMDLRIAAFPEGAVARAPLNHMAAEIRRSGVDRFDLWVFRSMAQTAVHELKAAMTSVAARG